jgi:PAS domain S-box-containing protein
MRSTSSELIDTMLALMPDAAVVVDAGGVITHHNDWLSRLFGYRADDLIGARIEVLIPERLRSVHRTHRGSFARDPRPRAMGAGLSLSGRRADGSEFPVDISLAPLALSGELATVASIRDVSDRAETDAVRSQLAAIVEGSADAIFALGLDGTIMSWNPGAQRTLGLDRADALGRHVSVLFVGGESVDFEDQMGAALGGTTIEARDTVMCTGDGTILPVAVVVSPLRSTGHEVTGFSVVARDITERTRAEIELRRLLAEGARNARWQQTTAEIRLQILDGASIDDVLRLSTERLTELIDAKGVLAIVGEPRRVVASSMLTAGSFDDLGSEHLPDAEGDLPELRRARSVDPVLVDLVGAHDLLLVPIGAGEDRVGSLLCVVDDEPPPWEVEVAISFAEQMALAIRLDRTREERDAFLIGDERGRIARDLHDVVIQRLFASGLSVQSVMPLVRDDRAAARLAEIVDELDTTIREIRTTIFTLAPPARSNSGLRAQVLDLVDESSRSLGFAATTHFSGPIDTVAGPTELATVLAVIREALANIARHAHACSARVEVTAGNGLEVTVTDDGVGIGELRRESGVRNLRQRAEELGGSLTLAPGSPSGTVLTWRIPLDRT